ncbi:MAG: hypothetical protein FJ102_04430 [Deltaproteobacteria bacterium]|nr:hypothetical protein [Deltaproteobacteria bacterium]
MTTAPPLHLAEFRLVRALRAQEGEGPFTQLWNAQAGHLWSAVRGAVRSDAEALGWLASFRIDLAEKAASFNLEEALGAQVGRALYHHLRDGLPAGGELPAARLPPTQEGVAELPPRVRLGYLVDILFDWTPPDPAVRAAYRLLEPAADTNARLVVYTACLRSPPVEALIFPPGLPPSMPAPRRYRPSPLIAALGTALLVAAIAWYLA